MPPAHPKQPMKASNAPKPASKPLKKPSSTRVVASSSKNNSAQPFAFQSVNNFSPRTKSTPLQDLKQDESDAARLASLVAQKDKTQILSSIRVNFLKFPTI